MDKNIYFITGFFGAPLMQRAQQLAEKHHMSIVSLDAEIEKEDGRSVRRICMMMGEHEYRNKEYETLKKISESRDDLIVICGDGVLHDDMSRELILSHHLEVVGGNMSCEELWENAKDIDNCTHAFMYFGTAAEKYAAFEDLFERQRVLFAPYIV